MHHSSDFRHCVLSNLDSGMSWDEAIRIFKISRSTISRWRYKRDFCGTLENIYPSVKERKINRDLLLKQINESPDSTLSELAKIFDSHPSVIDYHLRKMGITRKKNHALRRKK